MPVVSQFILISGLICASLALGYICRRLGLLPVRAAEWIMTFIAVFGYPLVGLLSIWAIRLKASDAWLPVIGITHMGIMTGLGLLLAKLAGTGRKDTGLFALVCGAGNNGFTMGGFVIYLLYGADGLGRANIYFVFFAPSVIMFLYPVARQYAGDGGNSLVRLLLRSIFDWRSIGLPMAVAGVALSLGGVARPAFIDNWRVMDILIYTLTPLAYFGIGLRLHLADFGRIRRMIAALAGARFVLGAAVGMFQVMVTWLTPWPVALASLSFNVILLESFVPTAVSSVAVANMFHLKPRPASTLFVANTVMYLLLVLPLVLTVFRR